VLRSDHVKPQSQKDLPKPEPLEEDEYYQKLEQIIARDFFPTNFVATDDAHIRMSLDEF
jgi:Nuclear protein Es2